MKSPFAPSGAASDLLRQLGILSLDEVRPLPGGRNNQVWRVNCGSQSFLLKRYFWSEQDPRDRLGQEWAFLCYLWDNDCRQGPKPLVKDPTIRCALLEFIEGVPLEVADIDAQDIHAATNFFLQLNARRNEAVSLPPVSEACFSIDAHLATTAARVERLGGIIPDTETHTAVQVFVSRTILPLWRAVSDLIQCRAGTNLMQLLPLKERGLSPSDFGFHNALRQFDGSLRFLDFEYAGWDDPAKTIIDFCNQPDRLLPDHLARIFYDRTLAVLPAAESLQKRIAILEPLYQLKWSCICLNGFLPGRTFSDPRPDRSPAAQLARSRTMADRATESLDALLNKG